MREKINCSSCYYLEAVFLNKNNDFLNTSCAVILPYLRFYTFTIKNIPLISGYSAKLSKINAKDEKEREMSRASN